LGLVRAQQSTNAVLAARVARVWTVLSANHIQHTY
jgi:hypothetical protein